jgi:hypothetical protein
MVVQNQNVKRKQDRIDHFHNAESNKAGSDLEIEGTEVIDEKHAKSDIGIGADRFVGIDLGA